MKIGKPKLKINLNIRINFTKLIYFFVFLIIFVFIIFISQFLYRNFFLVLNDVEVVYELQNQVAIDNINTKLFNGVEWKIEEKITKPLPNFDIIPNPFE